MKKPFRCTRLVWAFALLTTHGFSAPAGKGVLAGIVVDAATGIPVRKAKVTAAWLNTPPSWATVETGSSGQFRIEGLPPATYNLRAEMPGEGTAVYGVEHYGELGSTISLGEGEVRLDIKLRFFRLSAISGRVFNPDGQPAVNATVTLVKPGEDFPEPRQAPPPNGQTDDRGEYQIAGIPPGQYSLRANPPRLNSLAARAGGSASSDSLPTELIVPQFLGGGHELKNATVLTLHGGENLMGMDFHLTSDAPASISGRVILPASGSAAPGTGRVVVSVIPTGEEARAGASGQTLQGPAWAFHFEDLPPGRYQLEARAEQNGAPWAAAQLIDIRGTLGDVVLTLGSVHDIEGRLQMDGPAAVRMDALRVELAQAGRVPAVSARIAANGTFKLPRVMPGQWRLRIDPLPPGAFIKSARFGQNDVRELPLDVGSNSQDSLSVVISASTGRVTGDLAGAPGTRQAGIVLMPLDNRSPLPDAGFDTATSDGKFEIDGVPPGRYVVFALDNLVPRDFRTPEVLRQLAPFGQELTVGAAEKVQVHLKTIPEEQARQILPWIRSTP